MLVGLADIRRHKAAGVVEAASADAAVVQLRHQTVARDELQQDVLSEELRKGGNKSGERSCLIPGHTPNQDQEVQEQPDDTVLDSGCVFYLEDEFFDPGSLRQKVQHGEAGVGPHGRHADPVAAAGARSDVVGKPGQVVYEGVHPALVQPRHVDPGTQRDR